MASYEKLILLYTCISIRENQMKWFSRFGDIYNCQLQNTSLLKCDLWYYKKLFVSSFKRSILIIWRFLLFFHFILSPDKFWKKYWKEIYLILINTRTHTDKHTSPQKFLWYALSSWNVYFATCSSMFLVVPLVYHLYFRFLQIERSMTLFITLWDSFSAFSFSTCCFVI